MSMSSCSGISEREQEWRNQAAVRIAHALKLPVLATNGVRYATPYDREILDLLTAIRYHTELDRAGRLLAINNRRYLRPAQEMAALFRDIPGAIENTEELSSRLQFELADLGYKFPLLSSARWRDHGQLSRKRVEEGVIRRYGPKCNAALARSGKETG